MTHQEVDVHLVLVQWGYPQVLCKEVLHTLSARLQLLRAHCAVLGHLHGY